MLDTTRLIIVAMVTAVAVSAADNSVGTWNRNEEKSKGTGSPTGANPITSLTWNIEAVDGGAKLSRHWFTERR